MSARHVFPKPRIFGSAVVSPRGQIVIPASARRELSIGSGDTLLVCGRPQGEGLLLLKVEAVEQILSMLSGQLPDFETLARNYKSPKLSREKEAD